LQYARAGALLFQLLLLFVFEATGIFPGFIRGISGRSFCRPCGAEVFPIDFRPMSCDAKAAPQVDFV
jgi:hypothetical protein